MPAHVAVIGGGRWARQLTEALSGVVSPSVGISIHSPSNAGAMSAWAASSLPDRHVAVSPEWPRPVPHGTTAVIVANRASDHECAAVWALRLGMPVLVEKPVALTERAAIGLVDLARERGVLLAPAHIFRFATYLERFARLVVDAGPLSAMRVWWTDPRAEVRYGEQKHYDSTLPIFADWLPHVLSVISAVVPGVAEYRGGLNVERGGAYLELSVAIGDILCDVRMARTHDRRRRIIEVDTDRRTIQLDFSREPGTISTEGMTMVSDPGWSHGPRPSVLMLAAFLAAVDGSPADARLDMEPALRACQLIDQTASAYHAAVDAWLARRSAAGSQIEDDDVVYALAERRSQISNRVT